MKTSTQKVEFTPPEHAIPEGTEVGEDFDATCSFRVKGDGKVCLVMLGDAEMPGYSDKETAKEKGRNYDKYRQDMMAEPAGEPAGETGDMMG